MVPAFHRRVLACAMVAAGVSPVAAQDRAVVEASAPEQVAVTLYRDPDRAADDAMNRAMPRGFAMITERRRVTLPPGASTIRFGGVAEGMVAVSAIVTGLPGGVVEKNRNAQVLSPGALVDGTLGNRVTITRTDPATGRENSEEAVVRTRADGGIVLQTGAGFEAVRCSGLPERLTFRGVPPGLSAQPVFSIDTRSDAGGTYDVDLTYLAWGFDWQAHYVATVTEPVREGAVTTRLLSWLTLLNDNGQSFADAQVTVVAGRPRIVSDFRALAATPAGEPLRLSCWPVGDLTAGTVALSAPPPPPPPPAPPPPMMAAMARDAITVTGSRMMQAVEEDLGDLKLYRVPEPVTVAGKGLKQVAFLDRDRAQWQVLHRARCVPGGTGEAVAAARLLTTVNDSRHGLGVALPQGGLTLFESAGDALQLAGETRLRDHASGQDVELTLGPGAPVFVACETGAGEAAEGAKDRWTTMRAALTNATPAPVKVRLELGNPAEFRLRGIRTTVQDGQAVAQVTVPANGRRDVTWRAISTATRE